VAGYEPDGLDSILSRAGSFSSPPRSDPPWGSGRSYGTIVNDV